MGDHLGPGGCPAKPLKTNANAAKETRNQVRAQKSSQEVREASKSSQQSKAQIDSCAGIAAFYGNIFLPRPENEEYLFLRLGALRGDIVARHNIGQVEYDKGNYELSVRHWKIAAEAGSQPSLNQLKTIFKGKMSGSEFICKEYMDKVYRLCHAAQVAVWSEERAKHYDENVRDWQC